MGMPALHDDEHPQFVPTGHPRATSAASWRSLRPYHPANLAIDHSVR